VRYTATAGREALREAIVVRTGVTSWDTENALVCIGSQEAMTAALFVLADAGDEVLIPDPGYPAYRTLAELLGHSVRTYPLREETSWQVDAEAILSRVGPRTRVVMLCGPSNPTGAIAAPDVLDRLLPALQQRGVRWISDEIYEGLWYERPFRSLASRAEEYGGIVVSGVSKTWSMTGWRIGWAVGPKDWIAKAVAVHQHLVTCAPTISQIAAEAALSSEGCLWAERYRRHYSERRDRALHTLGEIPGLRVLPPEGAMYCFAVLQDGSDATEFCRSLLKEQSVVTIPGAAFGSEARSAIRLSFAVNEAVWEQAIERLKNHLYPSSSGLDDREF
jgi:aspartate/methionine/tyrosine aminotransferase